MTFLQSPEYVPIPLNTTVRGLTPLSLYLGQGSPALEVAVFSSSTHPPQSLLQQVFKKRRNGRATPVLIVVLHSGRAWLCGTGGDQPPITVANDAKQAEHLCKTALDLPDRHAAIRFLANALASLETALPGIVNEGLFSLHELTHGTRMRNDWLTAVTKAEGVPGTSGAELISALGFTSRRLDNLTKLLFSGKEPTALAVLLREDEVPEVGSTRFNNFSPVSYALTKADSKRLPWVLMVMGDRMRLYNTKNIGTGRRGRTETWVECQPSLLSSEDIGLLWLLFSADALKEGGSIMPILKESQRFAADVADKLRERIYDIVVPNLAAGIVSARELKNPPQGDIDLTYEMALTTLFRLLFIAYAEDCDLLPYKGNGAYRKCSLKKKALKLAKAAREGIPIAEDDDHWDQTVQLWRAVSNGNPKWGVPAYNGAMFSADPSVSRAGAELAEITLPNTVFEEALRGLLLTGSTEDSQVPVDFRSLSVREFGTIYEGLLESELSQAQQDLTCDKKGLYRPAKTGEQVFVRSGEIYLHDRSGARKSSGSYYTRDFAVEHLLDSALEPALDEHLERISTLSEADRAEQFFDFRVADIAMGSGHFLAAAVDRIEHRFALWLEENPTPGIRAELDHLRGAARKTLGDLADTVSIEDGQLLRRMIARRCIYGVDKNPLTVQLARLSIWIHTFVPGLPLSLLDHNLVQGNALVGVGSLDDIRNKFNEGAGSLFEVDADNLLGRAAKPLEDLAKLSDASVQDIEAGRDLLKKARLNTLETQALCDLITAQPLAKDPRLKSYQFEDWESLKGKVHGSAALRLAREILEPLSAFHFPIAFPEVFLGRTQGFNVILGNPPWEIPAVKENKFWARFEPGLAGLPPREQRIRIEELRASRPDLLETLESEIAAAEAVRKFLTVGNFPGMGTGDPDLCKAFVWRFWFVSCPEAGRVGVVLPRSILLNKGAEAFRRKLLTRANAIDVITIQNSGRWAFDMEPRYTIGLVSIARGKKTEKGITLRGPFTSLQSFIEGRATETQRFAAKEAMNWDESAALPLFPTPDSVEVFRQLRQATSLGWNDPDQWRARSELELHATMQRPLMDLESETCPTGFWKIYKGASFNLWTPDTGEYNAWGDPDVILPWLQAKRLKANKGAHGGVHGEFSRAHVEDPNTLAAYQSRIAYRDITNRTNSRTIIACLLPPKTFITDKGPVVLFPRGTAKDQAFLLGMLCSIPLDWYARRFVETNLTFFIFNSLPVPRAERGNLLWQRVVELAARLACPDERFADWAEAAGTVCGPLAPDEKEDMIYELDGVAAKLYGLSEAQLVHIFETFHEGWNYEPRLSAVRKHYRKWTGKA